jgi:hypothetical protein
MHHLVRCISILLLLVSCNLKDRKRESEFKTDLGEEGNQKVRDRFETFKESGKGCTVPATVPADGKKRSRAIVTGFGLFQDAEYNISGTVVESMMDPSFWPDSVNLMHSPEVFIQNLPNAADGRLDSEDKGVEFVTREITVNGRLLTVCFALVDVYWDLAAAIVIHEIEKFQPDMVFMTGRGAENPIYEWGAINQAKQGPAFESDGSVADESTPVDPTKNFILPPTTMGVEQKAPLLWDNKRLAEATKDEIAKLGYTAEAPSTPGPTNDYICNNISFAVVHAVKGVNVELAGGKIELKIAVPRIPKVGFFHFPRTAKNEKGSVLRWARVLAKSIITEI